MLEVKNEFKVLIGEEGIVVTYFRGNECITRLFAKSLDAADLVELEPLLKSDTEATVEIYIDVLDQNYIQRTLPGVGVLSIQQLADKRMEKETPVGHLKSALKIDRSKVGRKDWLYVYISAAYEAPISTWVEYFLQHGNVITGIYFLPVELVEVLNIVKLKASWHSTLTERESQKHSKLTAIKSTALNLLKQYKDKISANLKGSSGLEVLLVNNKTGGVRQVVYQNGKSIFTRLLNNISDPHPEVVAGNIEQEINNSLEYLRRLSLNTQDEVSIYMILSEDIKKSIRSNKITAKLVQIYTPYEIGQILDLPANIVKEEDRFAEPLCLAILKKSSKRLITVYTKEILSKLKVYNYSNYILKFLHCAIPGLALSIAYLVLQIYNLQQEIQIYQAEKEQLNLEIQDKMSTKKQNEDKFGTGANIEEIMELVSTYQVLTKVNFSPINIIMKVNKLNTDAVRVKQFDFVYSAEDLTFSPGDNPDAKKQLDQLKDKKGTELIETRMTIVFYNRERKYEDLVLNYGAFSKAIKKEFQDYEVKVAPLPSNLSLDMVPDEVNVEIILVRSDTAQLKKEG